MAELLSKEEFRKELEDAIKGNASSKAPFTVAWGDGKLERKHFARWKITITMSGHLPNT
ncbi:hypothetical protein QS257_21465 [Terrilactibacillus sp. S3-3]|nr:hypothetical protein QS257_21465 [Terrilactibacillus sp. S3-3]